LRYELNYTFDTDAVIPVDTGVFTTPNCATFYQAKHQEGQPEVVSSTTFPIPVDSELILGIGHQHIGARNISLWHNGKFLCASYPRYGTEEGVVGNEKGYLVEMSYCFDANDNQGKGYVLKNGDTLRLDSWYFTGYDDPILAPNPGGSHLNVMGYMFMAYKTTNANDVWPSPPRGPAPTARCQIELHHQCGSLIGFTDKCLACVANQKQQFLEAGCDLEAAAGACTSMGPAGSIVDEHQRRIVPIQV
jgi:hypothetical protein